MDITSQLEADLKQATLTRDQIRLDVIRMLKSSLKNYQIEVGTELTSAQILQVIQKEAKKRRDAIEAYEKNNRPELAAQEKSELQVLAEYLPAELSDQELEKIVDEAIASTGASGPADIGKVMPAVMSKVGGNASGARVSQLVRSKLTS